MPSDELFSVAGRTALVTGGARGVGRVIAGGLVEAGATVYVTSRSAATAEAAAAGLRRTHGLAADLDTEDGCRRLAAELAEREASLDILVNNAGVMGPLDADGLSGAVWQETMAVNVQAVFHLTWALLPLLRAAAAGGEPARVINVGSVAGSTTSDLDLFAFSASKAAVHHLTAHLARRLAPEITVNALSPGLFETRMTATVVTLLGEAIARGVPLRRLVRAEDLAGAAVFLASPAGAYLTGVVLPVDGGVSA